MRKIIITLLLAIAILPACAQEVKQVVKKENTESAVKKYA